MVSVSSWHGGQPYGSWHREEALEREWKPKVPGKKSMFKFCLESQIKRQEKDKGNVVFRKVGNASQTSW